MLHPSKSPTHEQFEMDSLYFSGLTNELPNRGNIGKMTDDHLEGRIPDIIRSVQNGKDKLVTEHGLAIMSRIVENLRTMAEQGNLRKLPEIRDQLIDASQELCSMGRRVLANA